MSDEEDEQDREEMPVEDIQPSGDIDMANFNRTERIATLIKRGGSIALAGSPRCTVFRVQGTPQGQRVTVMLDSGATLNFINSSLVQQRNLPMEAHVGFQVKVAGGTFLPCTHLVPQLSITMANHTMTEDFFIVDLAEMEVILGIQWMETLDEYTQSFKRMDFSFVADGKKVVL